MSKACFYVYAPLYQKNSNGIRMLYTLSETIRQCGYTSQVICYEGNSPEYDLLMPARYKHNTLKLNTEFSSHQLSKDDIVIYPDTISDNPLKGKNIVRYLLNRPIYLTGKPINYGSRDYLVAYSLRIDANLPQLFLLNDDSEYFHRRDFKEKESLVCIYYGKSADTEIKDRTLSELIDSFEQTSIITRDFPSTRVELGELLRRARLLVSLDPISNIIYESTLCGTPALVYQDIFGFSTQKFNIPLYGIFSDIKGYDEAIKDAALAFDRYQIALDENSRTVKRFVKDVLNHFEMLRCQQPVEHARIYLRTVARRNKSQSELDELRFVVNAKSSTLVNESNNLNLAGSIVKKIFVETGIKQNFSKQYLQIKRAIKQNKLLFTIFYRMK